MLGYFWVLLCNDSCLRNDNKMEDVKMGNTIVMKMKLFNTCGKTWLYVYLNTHKHVHVWTIIR